jgi:hypothetical protein
MIHCETTCGDNAFGSLNSHFPKLRTLSGVVFQKAQNVRSGGPIRKTAYDPNATLGEMLGTRPS